MVERERDEGEAMVVYGPRHEGGGGDEAVEAEAVVVAAAGEKGEGERDDDTERGGEEERKEEDEEVEKEKKDEVVLEEWSEIRLAIAELSPISHGKLSSSPPTLPFLSISLLILQVLDKIGPTMAVLRLDVQRNIEEVIIEDSHVAKIGIWLPRMQLPLRSIEEVRQELLRQQARWNRVVELKNIEAGLGFQSWINTDSTEITMLPKTYALHMQHYPDDAEFVNRRIKHFAWLNKIFGPVRDGLCRPNTYADALAEAAYDEYDDNDFMPTPVKSKGKSAASSKAKRTSTSKAKSTSGYKAKTTVAFDEDSCDDFTPRSAARFKAMKAKSNAASSGKRLFD